MKIQKAVNDDVTDYNNKTQVSESSIKRVAIAGLIGSTIEWYDFYIYGLAAALVFGREFFPDFSPVAGTLAAFGTFAVGFVARPLGGLIFGHFGDRIGRKRTLVLTLFMMGFATVLIGIVPNFNTIGLWAPVILVVVRFVQGFAVGGEWGGAVTMVVESSPARKRGFYGSLPQMGVPLGLVLSSVAFALAGALPEDDFVSWGWRIPFLMSAALIGVGMFIRLRISETPAFTEMQKNGTAYRVPALEAIRNHWRAIGLTAGMYLAAGVPFYIVTVFVLSHGTKDLGIPRSVLLTSMLIAACLEAFSVPFFGALSDRNGRKPVFMAGAVFMLLLAFPFFWLLASGVTGLIWAAMILAIAVAHGAMYGPTAALYAEMFGAGVRYTGTSLGYQLGGVVAGFVPIAAGALVSSANGASWPVALLWMAAAAVGVIAVALTKETRGNDLLDVARVSNTKTSKVMQN